jgi:clan AA aspartic protease
MGQLHVQVTLSNMRELVMARLSHLTPAQVHTVETEALVDTGAMHLVVPDTLADQLGLLRLRTQAVTMADGRDGVYDQTEAVTIALLGRAFDVSALVMGHTVLLGAMVLEGLDLAVDPVRQRLMPNLGT